MSTTPVFPDLSQASVFITGGGSGIGAALTQAFLRQGAKVAFVQRSDASGFCDEMERETGNRPLYLPCDITHVSTLQAAIARAAEAHGPVRILVNNAANDQRHDTLEMDEAGWQRLIDINL
ncbi:SDR family NAD(P)-dependent oxidoreductase, partial [Pararhodobacter marinus]